MIALSSPFAGFQDLQLRRIGSRVLSVESWREVTSCLRGTRRSIGILRVGPIPPCALLRTSSWRPAREPGGYWPWPGLGDVLRSVASLVLNLLTGGVIVLSKVGMGARGIPKDRGGSGLVFRSPASRKGYRAGRVSRNVPRRAIFALSTGRKEKSHRAVVPAPAGADLLLARRVGGRPHKWVRFTWDPLGLRPCVTVTGSRARRRSSPRRHQSPITPSPFTPGCPTPHARKLVLPPRRALSRPRAGARSPIIAAPAEGHECSPRPGFDISHQREGENHALSNPKSA